MNFKTNTKTNTKTNKTKLKNINCKYFLKAIFQIYREATFQDFEAKNEREPSQSENLFRILKEVFLTFKMLKEFFLNKFCQN